MTPQQYFTLPPEPGKPHARYAVLARDGHTVIGVQASRPDGDEIARPARLTWQLRPFAGGAVKTPWFNNVPPSAGPIKDAAEKRRRGFQAGWARRAKAGAE
jgi:hypothetical protein